MCSTWTAFLGSLNIWGKIRKKEICYHDVARRGWNISISLVRWGWLLLYSTILCSRADSLHSHVILHEWLAYFIVRFLISTEVVHLQHWHGWCHMNLLPSRRVLCTPYNHTPCHFMQSHIHKVYACLAVTGHLHFWQDDRDLLRATAVTRGWNGYRNRSQHRKLTLEKKILLPLPQGFEPTTFQSRVREDGTPASLCSEKRMGHQHLFSEKRMGHQHLFSEKRMGHQYLFSENRMGHQHLYVVRRGWDPLSSHKMTLKQQINGQKWWKMKEKDNDEKWKKKTVFFFHFSSFLSSIFLSFF